MAEQPPATFDLVDRPSVARNHLIVETKPLWSPCAGAAHRARAHDDRVGGRAEELLRDRRGRRAGHPFREAASLEVRVGVSVVNRLRCGYADDQGGETCIFSEAEREFRHEKRRQNSDHIEQKHTTADGGLISVSSLEWVGQVCGILEPADEAKKRLSPSTRRLLH